MDLLKIQIEKTLISFEIWSKTLNIDRFCKNKKSPYRNRIENSFVKN